MENQNTVLKLTEIDNLTGSPLNDSMFEMFKKVRRQTIELVETLENEDFVVQTDRFMSPPRCHLGGLMKRSV